MDKEWIRFFTAIYFLVAILFAQFFDRMDEKVNKRLAYIGYTAIGLGWIVAAPITAYDLTQDNNRWTVNK
jgi:Na+/proline symporter